MCRCVEARTGVARLETWVVCYLLAAHACLLAWSAACHSPTDLEPPFLVSGISHWHGRGFELYRANPPLVRMVAAIPVVAAGDRMGFEGIHDNHGSRAEFTLEHEFLRIYGANVVEMIMYARWACIPFSLIGAYFAYRWAKDLYGGSSGVLTLLLYICEPNLLAHGELLTPDAAATSLGILASYSFWRWLKRPTWTTAIQAGGALGLAELSKFTWLILFGLWPVLWITRELLNSVAFKATAPKQPPMLTVASPQVNDKNGAPLLQLGSILALAMCVINLGYGFDGVGIRLRDFRFVSKALTGLNNHVRSDNRFRDSWIGKVPIILPKEYILGIDSQKKDLEKYHLPSYLRGEVKKRGGWWYYYVYGLLVKVPRGTLGLLVLVVLCRLACRARPASFVDEVVLLAPALVVLSVVSCHMEFNRHLRYVFPSLGMFLIFLGQAGSGLKCRFSMCGAVVVCLTAESILSLACTYPHHLAYFNGFAGGSQYGYRHLLGSSLDWGQDLLFLRDYVVSTGSVVEEMRGSDIKRELVRTIIPTLSPKMATGRRIVVYSPNCLEKGAPFPPPDSFPLTPTMWIVKKK